MTVGAIDLRGLRALIVDDNATNRRVLEETLSHWHMVPTTAPDGKTALALLAAAHTAGQDYDIVILDGHMPEMDGFDVAGRIRQMPEFASATIMMLTSGAHAGDANRCRDLSMDGYLLKPVSQGDLAEAIRRALASRRGAPQAGAAEATAAVPARTPDHATRRAMRVLLAEHNPVNQMVAMRILEKQGHTVVLAENGAKAVEAFQSQTFDLVLMDVQMPVLSGFEATEEIRRLERSGSGRVPIIGLTAHAMKGDRERCLAAGMDGYVPKPIKPRALFAAIDALIEPAAPIPLTDVKAGVSHAVIDLALALENVGGDPGLLSAVAAIWLTEGLRRLDELRLGLREKDSGAIERAAHSLQGSLGTLGASAAALAAERIEAAAVLGDLAEAETWQKQLELEITRLKPELEHLSAVRRAA